MQEMFIVRVTKAAQVFWLWLFIGGTATMLPAQRVHEIKSELLNLFDQRYSLSYETNLSPQFSIEILGVYGRPSISLNLDLAYFDVLKFPTEVIGVNPKFKYFFYNYGVHQRHYVLLEWDYQQLNWVHPQYVEWYQLRFGKQPKLEKFEWNRIGAGYGYKVLLKNHFIIEPNFSILYDLSQLDQYWSKGISSNFSLRFGYRF